MNAITAKLLPIEVVLPDGRRPAGEVMYQLNKTKDGFVVALVNNRGIDKTQNGIARVDRRAFVDVILRTNQKVESAREFTEPRALEVQGKARTLAEPKGKGFVISGAKSFVPLADRATHFLAIARNNGGLDAFIVIGSIATVSWFA